MHEMRKWVLALAAVAVWAVPARPADKEELVPGPGAVKLMLLRHKPVREELKLSEDQAHKIHEFTAAQWQKAKALADGTAEGREEKFEEMAKENNHYLHELLTPEQRKRLNQIGMQKAGLIWLTKPEVATELNLTDEQKKKAHELQEEAHKQYREFLHESNPEVKKEEIQALRKKDRERLMNLLTDDQKKKWKELAGEPFTADLGEPSK